MCVYYCYFCALQVHGYCVLEIDLAKEGLHFQHISHDCVSVCVGVHVFLLVKVTVIINDLQGRKMITIVIKKTCKYSSKCD